MTTNLPEFSILRTSKIYPNWDFGFENKQSGNPVPRQTCAFSRDRQGDQMCFCEKIAQSIAQAVFGPK
jgi:hypothetical protein